MLKIKLSVLGLISWMIPGAFAQVNNFETIPQKPVPGQTVQITYDPHGTPLAGAKSVHGIVYSYNNYHWQTSDLDFVPVGNGKFKATLLLDKKSGIASVKFIAGDSTDTNHDLSYTIMTIDPARATVNAAGAYAGWGFLRADKQGYGVPGYFTKPQALSDTAFYYWLNNEILWHSKEAGELIAVPFAKSILAYQGEVGKPRINNIVKYMMQKNDEPNLIRARSILLNVLREKTRADSLDTVLLKRYPAGGIARLNAYKAFNTERDLDKKRSLGEYFLKAYPHNDYNEDFDQENRIAYSNVYQTVIILGYMRKEYTILDRYVNELPFTALINLYYKVIEIAHSRKDEADAVLLPYAQKLVDRMEQFKNAAPPEYWYLPPSQWYKQYQSYVFKSVFPVHVSILCNTGNYKQALLYAARTENFYQYKRASVNDDYAFLLNKTKQYAKLHTLLEKSVFENQSSPEMLSLLKADYQRKGNPAYKFDAYMASLKNPALAVENAAEIKKKMINFKMPDWNMTGLDGKLVKFADLKGKTIVLDFWATWCVPCKASFPGMKMAVERYKADPNVVFYFVDTEERGEKYKEEVARFMKANNYPFQILFDNKAAGAKINDEVFARICKTFKISGIPMKLIIDAKGKLRFLTDGYKGSPTALADEIYEMVELARKSE